MSDSLTTEQFVKSAKQRHGNRYDYRRVSYKNLRTKVKIICREHGPFDQIASTHLNGAGCKRCADVERGKKKREKAAATFEVRARASHGNKYDYSRVNYELASKKVEILCPKHGTFYIRPNSHVRGIGCPDCGTEAQVDKQRMTLEEFISAARKIHGNKYDYSQTHYVSTHNHVDIICSVHGVFRQAPSGHLAGRGCVLCAAKINADRMRLGTDEFITRARNIHGETYDYSEVEYKTNLTPVTIICPKHGLFMQAPSKHIDAKQGCPSCANRDMNLKKFIERAQAIHDNEYDYSLAEYRGARRKIKIVCPEHGVFEQAAQHHMAGFGCEKCVDTLNSKGSQLIEAWLQSNRIEYEREKKFDSLKSEKSSRYRLRWDFYLPEFLGLIEFDGQQHFRPNPHWGGERAFKRIQTNDACKNEWAIQYGFHLVRIRYDQVNEIGSILQKEFGR